MDSVIRRGKKAHRFRGGQLSKQRGPWRAEGLFSILRESLLDSLHWLGATLIHRDEFARTPARRSPRRGRVARSRRSTFMVLEERRVLSAGALDFEPLAIYSTPVPPGSGEVAGRYMFYNQSRFDRGSAEANVYDDEAIATDKTPLLPGQSANFANYTSYSRGINGLMIDIANLPGTLTASDFEFRHGNDNRPQGWELAPAPQSISLRAGAGVNGSTRVTLIWANNTLQNEWLQVTVKATPNTALAKPDTFYVGNAIGETGNSLTDAAVNALDETAIQANIRGWLDPASVTNRYDLDRDAVVGVSDELIVSNVFSASSASGLQLVQPPDPSAAALTQETSYIDFVNVDVLQRLVFYNNSSRDGNNLDANSGDDAAIAIGKSALLPGQTASFANYTSYTRGINGVMMDIAGLPGTLTADDFEFRIGNSSDPSTWRLAPLPSTVTLRAGAGQAGSTRVTITWPDGAIRNTWLQVTLKATPRSGLSSPDVFYFGNAPGDSGDNSSNAVVSIPDVLRTQERSKMALPASLADPFDHDRNGTVDTDDVGASLSYQTSLLTDLELITPPVANTAPVYRREPTDLFTWGDAGYTSYYYATLVRTPSGVLIALAEARSDTGDPTARAVVMRRSFDDGVTWTPYTVISSVPINSPDTIGSLAPVVDETTGTVSLLYTLNINDVFVMNSFDDGATWTTPRNVTASVKVTAEGNPNPDAFPSTPWGWYAVGPGHGIQLKYGEHAGRLMIAGDHRLGTTGASWSHVIYSDDGGLTWQLGGGLAQDSPYNLNSNEATLVEQSDGTLYMSIRVNGQNMRGSSRSTDGGQTWSIMAMEPALTVTPVQSTLLRLNDNVLLFAAPEGEARSQMTIWVSYDDAATWQKTKTVFYDFAGYSDMVALDNDTVLLSYSRGHVADNVAWFQKVGLVRFNLRYLESADPAEFNWYFNEESVGTKANISGPSIQDYSPWDNRATPQASGTADAPVYVDGTNGDVALRLTKSIDRVLLAPGSTGALQFGAADSFTAQLVLRTTDTNGVILGMNQSGPGWSVQLVNGRVQFNVNDGTQQATITTAGTINDGAWHHLAVVRDKVTNELRLYVDRVLAAAPVADPTGSLRVNAQVYLGTFTNLTGQLAFDVDTLRVTRAVVAAQDFLAADFVASKPYPVATHSATAPDSIDGLRFWMPAYDASHYFSDAGFSDPMPLDPVVGDRAYSAVDRSGYNWRAGVAGRFRFITYHEDTQVGSYWDHDGSVSTGSEWIVQNSNGSQPNNFDFIQNTGEFTISMFVKPDVVPGGYMVLMDTSNGGEGAGFMLYMQSDGRLGLKITASDGSERFNELLEGVTLETSQWYHVALVGSGEGQGVQFYVTPVTSDAVQSHDSVSIIVGANGSYPTDWQQNLTIGGRSNSLQTPFNGALADPAIYDRALTSAEIQQLFDYTKR